MRSMPDFRRATCQRCNGHKSYVGPISWSGLCQECAIDRVTENIVGLATKETGTTRRWRRGLAAGIGAVLVDDERAAS